ncbi:unnamed protein product [Musa hybrid cultivar]
MGFVIVISLPLILFAILVAFGCYFLGRKKGRQDVRAGVGSQVYGVPLPPPGAAASYPPTQVKKQAGPDDV